MRCSPRRRSPTARSLTHRPPSRLTSSVWKRLQRRSRWSGPPQTAPPHGSPTDAGDEADDEAAAAASGGGEATQRHNTLLTIRREAGAPGARQGRRAGRDCAEARRVSSDGERGLRDAGKLAGEGPFPGAPSRPAALLRHGHAPRQAAGQSQAQMKAPPRRGGAYLRTTLLNGEGVAIPRSLGPIQTAGGGDWLNQAISRSRVIGRRKAPCSVTTEKCCFELRNYKDVKKRLCTEKP